MEKFNLYRQSPTLEHTVLFKSTYKTFWAINIKNVFSEGENEEVEALPSPENQELIDL